MVIERYEAGQDRKFPMGIDIADQLQEIEEMQPADPSLWQPLFEPAAFNEAHGPLLVENFRLNEAQLRDWAGRCVRLR